MKFHPEHITDVAVDRTPKWKNVTSHEGAEFLLAYVSALRKLLTCGKKGRDREVFGEFAGEKILPLTRAERASILTEINSVKSAVNRWKRHEQLLAA